MVKKEQKKAHFPTQPLLLMTLTKEPFEIIVGKGGKDGNQHFLLFPQCFIPYERHQSSIDLLNPLPDDKILDWSELKLIADDILTLSQAKKI